MSDQERPPAQKSTPKSNEEWKETLTPEQYHVTREGGTERAFTGCYWETKDPGLYRCVCCDAALYRSETKFDSGSGWPSFFQPVNDEAIETLTDQSHGMTRTEARCLNCGAHLGHVFPDGPRPTGMRHCINSAALRLEKENVE